MSRLAIAGGVIWIAIVALLVFGSAADLWRALPNAYLCGWLVLVSLPLGALPLLMLLELRGLGDAAVAAPLRLLLASLPVLAVVILPLFFSLHGAYTWQSCRIHHCPPFHFEGFGDRWFTPGGFAGRAVLYLVLWVGLSLYFLRPARPTRARRRLAAFGLGLHLVLGTLASYDWFMSLDEGAVSSNYGLLVISLQCAFALSAALLMLVVFERIVPSRRSLHALLVLAGAAAFAQFVEFLVVWSANLPKEIAWYQDRAAGGSLFAAVAPAILLTGGAALLPERLAANRVVVAAVLAAFLLVGFVDLVLLASPHDLFVANFGVDLLATAALGGAAGACAFWLGGSSRRELRHG